MKRIFAAILILAMTLFVPSTWAESKHIEEILFSSECAVAFMQMKLLENRERFSGEKQTGFADRLLDLNFTAPSEAYEVYSYIFEAQNGKLRVMQIGYQGDESQVDYHLMSPGVLTLTGEDVPAILTRVEDSEFPLSREDEAALEIE